MLHRIATKEERDSYVLAALALAEVPLRPLDLALFMHKVFPDVVISGGLVAASVNRLYKVKKVRPVALPWGPFYFVRGAQRQTTTKTWVPAWVPWRETNNLRQRSFIIAPQNLPTPRGVFGL